LVFLDRGLAESLIHFSGLANESITFGSVLTFPILNRQRNLLSPGPLLHKGVEEREKTKSPTK
jgi:hypothetical protein